MLALAGIRISMDSRDRWTDILIERLWRSLKHEDVCLNRCADGHEVEAGSPDESALQQSR